MHYKRLNIEMLIRITYRLQINHMDTKSKRVGADKINCVFFIQYVWSVAHHHLSSTCPSASIGSPYSMSTISTASSSAFTKLAILAVSASSGSRLLNRLNQRIASSLSPPPASSSKFNVKPTAAFFWTNPELVVFAGSSLYLESSSDSTAAAPKSKTWNFWSVTLASLVRNERMFSSSESLGFLFWNLPNHLRATCSRSFCDNLASSI